MRRSKQRIRMPEALRGRTLTSVLAMVLAEGVGVAGGMGADTEQEIIGRKVSYAARR